MQCWKVQVIFWYTLYSGTDEKVTKFSFPANSNECNKWIPALPSKIKNFTKYIIGRENQSPTGY